MPTRRRSRADQRKSLPSGINTPFLDRRSEKPREIKITIIEKGQNLGIVLKHEIVADNLLPLQEAIRQQIDRPNFKRVVINMQEVPYIDTSAVSMLTESQRQIKEAGKEMIIVNLHPRVAHFFDILNLHTMFDVRIIK